MSSVAGFFGFTLTSRNNAFRVCLFLKASKWMVLDGFKEERVRKKQKDRKQTSA